MRPGSWQRGLAITAFGLCVGGILWAPAFLEWERSGFGDWQQFHHWWEIGVVSIRRWGEWPLWDPHHCGGVSQWGQPQAQNYGPLYLLLAVPFGTVIGHKLFLLVHTAIGFSGTYVLARREERYTRAGAFFAATVWCISGFYAWHGSGGHSTFLAFYYAPWLLLTWRWSYLDVRWTAVVAALMTELLLEGGHYPFPYAVVLLGFDTVARFRPSSAWPAVRTILVGGGLTALLGALRWVPILIAMSRHPRPIEDTDSLTLAEVLEMLTAREHGWSWPGHPWVWPEYGTYVGYGVLALGAIGAAISLTQRRFAAIFGAGLFLAMSMGNRDWYWPSPLLHHVPFVSNLHVPSRWQVYFTFYLALLAGLALSALDRRLSQARFGRDADWARPLVAWAIALCVVADLYVVALSITNRWDGPALGEQPVEEFHLVRPGRYHEEYSNYPSRNVGTIECYDAVPWHRSTSLWTGEQPQVRIVASDPAERRAPREGDELHGFHRTNHTAWADVTLGSPGRVIFDQNFESQWRASSGTLVDDDTRLAVDLPAGRHRISVYFAPDDLPYSVIASGLGVIACALVWRYGGRRRSARRERTA